VTAHPLLSTRQLNRATLRRQLLLERVRMPALAAVDQLVGLQAQVPDVPYLALWLRLEPFDPGELADLLRQRAVVRMALMRATLHLVSARDAVGLRSLMDPVLQRTFTGTTWSKKIPAADVADVLRAGAELLDREHLTRAALGRRLHERFPHVDPETLGMLVTYRVPTVQPTPRGLWGRSGQATWTTLRSWLGADQVDRATADSGGAGDTMLHFLAAYGPATVRDVQAWCGLTRLAAVADQLGGRLRRFRTEDGAELLDVPDGALPEPDVPAPPRFVPEYDNALLAYADRRRVVADAAHEWLQGGPGGYVGSLLVDGFVSATWAARRAGSKVTLEIRRSLPIPREHLDAVLDEAGRLLTLVAPHAEHDVRLT